MDWLLGIIKPAARVTRFIQVTDQHKNLPWLLGVLWGYWKF